MTEVILNHILRISTKNNVVVVAGGFFFFFFFGQRAQSGGQHACLRQACVALHALNPEEEARLFPRRTDSQQTTAEITLILYSQESRRKNHRLGVERKDRKVSKAQRPPPK